MEKNSSMSGMLECQECWECQDRQTVIKCDTFLEAQVPADLNDDRNFGNVTDWGNVRNAGMSGMFRISGMLGQTSSVIPFQNHNLELILMMMGIWGMVGLSGILGMSGMLRISGMSGHTWSVTPFRNHDLKLLWMIMRTWGMVGILGISEILNMSGMLRISEMSGQISSVKPFRNLFFMPNRSDYYAALRHFYIWWWWSSSSLLLRNRIRIS